MPQVKLILVVVVLFLGWGVSLRARRPVRDVEKREGKSAMPRSGLPKAGSGLPKAEASYLALGDSYTIGESVDPEERYPAQVRRLLVEHDHLAVGDPEIIAVTGWTTGNLLEALRAEKPDEGDGRAAPAADSGEHPGTAYDIVSLLIGVNNQYQGRDQEEYRGQFEQLLRQCIRLAGNRPSHVLVLSIPDYSVTPFGRTRGRDTAMIAAQIDSFNGINYELARTYKVNYIDVTAGSRKAGTDPSLIAFDGLHYSGKEYASWAQLMEPVLKGMLE